MDEKTDVDGFSQSSTATPSSVKPSSWPANRDRSKQRYKIALMKAKIRPVLSRSKLLNAPISPRDRTHPAPTKPVSHGVREVAGRDDGISPSTLPATSQLKELIGKQAVSTYDKLQLLEQRDKIIRKFRVKINDVNKAETFKGTCPDMCPEKERYRREVQKLLHPFEILPSPQTEVDHVRAVKDYARSSADQEEPLPHDLRSAEVLERTMHYLISQVVVKEPEDDSQLAVWYDFLWTRTRAIRKDITQQMLSDVVAVSLIEQCVRFHIYAAHRLCELDIGVFDQKMNTENLRKSLLTLRHMYEDLNKSTINCENEAEFRCYDVLLNLKDSNILRQVLTFKESVRQSEPIRFALKLFIALQNNNYVSFFRLLRQKATYLQACVAHRYFTDVRSEALKIMVRAFSGGSQTAVYTFPVTEVTKTLSFENDAETLLFCASFNLMKMPSDPNVLILNRSTFAEPESPPDSKRSLNLVECKRTTDTAELISGAPIQPFTFITPVVSFDADHRYVNDTVIKNYLDDVDSTDLETIVDDDQSSKILKPASPSMNVMYDIMQRRVADKLVNEIATYYIKKVISMELSERLTHVTLYRFVDDFLRETINNVCVERRKFEIELEQRKQRDLLLYAFSSQFSEKLFDLVAANVVKEIVSEEYRSAKNEALKKLEAINIEIGESIFRSVVENETKNICQEIFSLKVDCRKTTLRRIRAKLELLSVRKCVDFWRSKTKRRKRVRELLADFPAVPGCSLVSCRSRENGGSPPKRLRLSSHRDCPSPNCCQLRNTEISRAQHHTDVANAGGLENNYNNTSRSSNNTGSISMQEIRAMLDNLKKGIKREKMFIEDEKVQSNA